MVGRLLWLLRNIMTPWRWVCYDCWRFAIKDKGQLSIGDVSNCQKGNHMPRLIY